MDSKSENKVQMIAGIYIRFHIVFLLLYGYRLAFTQEDNSINSFLLESSRQVEIFFVFRLKICIFDLKMLSKQK